MHEKAIIKKPAPKKAVKKKPKDNHNPSIICSIVLVVLIVITIALFRNVISKGASAISKGYSTTFEEEKESAYQTLYQKYYDEAEAKYHVSNRATIHIDGIKETNKLEVLRVSDTEFIIEDGDNNSGNVTSWLEVIGNGTYIVDLSLAEFIIDSERAHVSVRLPFPELTNITLDYPSLETLLFEKGGIANGNYKEGVALADKQLREADVKIRKELASNENYYKNAQNAARSTIQILIRQMNPDVADLSVDVEFY